MSGSFPSRFGSLAGDRSNQAASNSCCTEPVDALRWLKFSPVDDVDKEKRASRVRSAAREALRVQQWRTHPALLWICSFRAALAAIPC
jgi:hypothetical protein